jgi:hypothetical protein
MVRNYFRANCTITSNSTGLKTVGCSLRFHFSPQFLAR